MLAAAGLVWPQAKIICFLPDFKNSFISFNLNFHCNLLLNNKHLARVYLVQFPDPDGRRKKMCELTVWPIKSCLRMDDELVSNYGPPLRKSVTFNDIVETFGDVVALEPSPATSTSYRITFNGRNSTPFELPASQPQRKRPVNPQRKNLRVSFSPFYLTIEPCGRTYTSVTALEEESEYWKPGALDGEPFCKMNCQNLICF